MWSLSRELASPEAQRTGLEERPGRGSGPIPPADHPRPQAPPALEDARVQSPLSKGHCRPWAPSGNPERDPRTGEHVSSMHCKLWGHCSSSEPL